MKKVIFSMCLAALAIGCAKTEVQFEETDLISFTPVTHTQTKAALASGAVPTTNLIVSASAGPAGATSAASCTEAYFNKVSFTQDGTTGVFTALGYFWPNVKYLSFAGVTNAAGLENATSLDIDVKNNKIEIVAYPQQEVGTLNNDLLWFESTTPKGKPSPTNSSYRAEAVTMKHACSWLVFNFYGDDTAGNTDRPWKITNVTINDLAASGKAILTSSASWPAENLGLKEKDLQVYNDGDKTSGGKEMQQLTPFIPSENGIIVIPQEPTTISVTYNYVSQFGADDTKETDDIVIEETKTVSLAYNGTAAWAPGTKYTYDIQLTATGIKIAPTASTWVDYDSDGNSSNGNQSIPGTI